MPRACALLALAVPAALGSWGCARQAVPDPAITAREFAAAADRGDADAIYALLDERSRRALGLRGARAKVRGNRQELRETARGLSGRGVRVAARAELRFEDGERAELSLEQGRFRVASAGTLPARASTPAQALGQLRTALARRSYTSLVRVLSRDTGSALETDLRSLVTGLEEPETLDIRVDGDTAEVLVPGGHRVKLKREAGVWRIQDFD